MIIILQIRNVLKVSSPAEPYTSKTLSFLLVKRKNEDLRIKIILILLVNLIVTCIAGNKISISTFSRINKKLF
jgi:hypothetical protein